MAIRLDLDLLKQVCLEVVAKIDDEHHPPITDEEITVIDHGDGRMEAFIPTIHVFGLPPPKKRQPAWKSYPGWRRLGTEPGEKLPTNHRRPKTRKDCESSSQCPWCGEIVSMRIEPGEGDGKDANNRFDRETIRNGNRSTQGRDGEERSVHDADVVDSMRLRKSENGQRPKPSEGGYEELRVRVCETRDVWNPGIQRVDVNAGQVRQPEEQDVQILRRAGDSGNGNMENVSTVFQRHGTKAIPETLSGQNRRKRKLRSEQLQVGYGETTAEESPHISCPNCGGRVRYVGGMDGARWFWEKHNTRTPETRLDRRGRRHDPIAPISHCRPCIWVGCRHHAALEVNDTGHARIREGWEDRPTCSLDLADEGGMTLDECGEVPGVTRERARQIEARGLIKLRHRKKIKGEE